MRSVRRQTRLWCQQCCRTWKTGQHVPQVCSLATKIITNPLGAQSRCFVAVGDKTKSSTSLFSSSFDPNPTVSKTTLETILERAHVHGIDDLNRLAFEADLGPSRHPSNRLLEDDSIRQDLDLWAILLDYRKLRHGPDGVRDVLAGMLYEGVPVRLHADAVSEHIWHTILPVLFTDDKHLYRMCQASPSFFKGRPYVFADIVGQLLAKGNLRLAVIFATQLLLSHFRGQPDLLHLFDIVFRNGDDQALSNYCGLLTRLPRYKVYNNTVPKLCLAGKMQHAFILHRHLLTLGDHPTSIDMVEPLIRELAARDLQIEPFVRELEIAGISFTHQSRRLYTQERSILTRHSRPSSDSALAPGPGTRPVKLNDSFVARTFATRSISFDFVLSSLRFVGLFEVGPLAIREIASSAESLDELQRRFRRLDEMEIDLGASEYVRTVRNLCMTGNNKLLQSVLQSDMHHEVFEDTQKQKQLLSKYYQNRKWTDIDRTLAILSGGKNNKQHEKISSQLILQAALLGGDWRGALVQLDTLRTSNQNRLDVNAVAPVRLALRRIWTQVSQEMRKETSYLRRELYLLGFMQLAQAAGLRIQTWQWRTTLHAIGRSGNWSLFHNTLWATMRLLHNSSAVANAQLTQTRELIDQSLQALIIEVSLIGDGVNLQPTDLWIRGVELLRSMHDRFDVEVDYKSINASLRVRLEGLFRGADIEMRARLVNRYLSHLNWAWTQTSSSSQDDVRQIEDGHPILVPDATTLKLLQARSKLDWYRRMPVEAKLADMLVPAQDVDGLNEDGFEVIEKSAEYARAEFEIGRWQFAGQEVHDSAIFYEDLLHPSYENAKDIMHETTKQKKA